MNEISIEEAVEILTRKMNEIKDQMARLEQCIEYIQEGKLDLPIIESELYTEETSNRDDAESLVPHILEHLLKLKYCTNNRNYKKWIEMEIEPWINVVKRALNYESNKRKNINLINEINSSFDEFYNDGIKYYHKDSEEYKDLILNKKFIPKECPWTLDRLLTNSIPQLLDKLPDPDELTTQMQLYPFCHFSQDYDKIRGMQCSECKFYSECTAEYYERLKNREG